MSVGAACSASWLFAVRADSARSMALPQHPRPLAHSRRVRTPLAKRALPPAINDAGSATALLGVLSRVNGDVSEVPVDDYVTPDVRSPALIVQERTLSQGERRISPIVVT